MHITAHRRPRRAFTLIEVLVVIGIVVLLGGLLLVAVSRSYKAGVRARQTADLTLIGTALEAYKADFGDYPRFDNDNANPGFNTQVNRGAALLCRALLGPAPAIAAPTWASDGADGYGFRVRPGGAGKVYGPYIQPDKFKIGTIDLDQYNPQVTYSNAGILDRFGNAICYLPAATPPSVLTVANGYVSSIPPTGNDNAPTAVPLYNAIDMNAVPNWLSDNSYTQTFSTTQLRTILGATTTGAAGPNPAYTGSYILWSAGPDRIFGLDANNKTDDITNFDIPPQFRK